MTRKPKRVAAHVLSLFALFAASALAATSQAAVLRVHPTAPPGGDGAGWATAFNDLQAALAAAAPGDELWVAAGTYTPANAASSFVMHSGVALYGGFAGDESSRTQRDWTANPTILSGDIGHDDEYGPFTWYIGWNIHTDNCDHVVIADGVDAGAVLDGFTVTQAHGAYSFGAGMRIDGGSPTVANCVFLRNETGWGAGAGIGVNNGSPTIANCSFTQNWCHICNGAGIYVTGTGSPSIADCTFTENHAVADSGSSGQGSAISVWNSAPVRIVGCTFQYNSATRFSLGSIEYGRGAGISAFGSVVDVRDCVFHHNTADFGAGIAAWSDGRATNCAFWSNTATYSSAGVMCYSFTAKTFHVTNCALAGNSAGEGAAFEAYYSATVALENSIVWDNTATGQGVDPRDRQFKGNATIEYSCVKDLLTAPPGEDPYDPANYPGSFDADPLFVNRPAGDLRLSSGSPCIDAGKNSFVPAGITADLDGVPRLRDDCLAANTGVGSPPVDMGAFERAGAPYVTQHPASQSRVAGESVTFVVSAAGSGTLTYQWRRNGVNLSDGGSASGANTAALTLNPVSLSDAAGYDVIVTGACGSASSDAALLTVTSPCVPCDVNCDGSVNPFDIQPFIAAISAGPPAPCSPCAADANGDGTVNPFDIQNFVDCLIAP